MLKSTLPTAAAAWFLVRLIGGTSREKRNEIGTISMQRGNAWLIRAKDFEDICCEISRKDR